MKSYKVTEVGLTENCMKKFKGIMEGNSEIKLVSSMFSLYSHWSIYVFNTEGLSGALTEELLKQSPAYAAQLTSTQTLLAAAAQEGTQGHTCIGTGPGESSWYDLLQDQIFTKLLVSFVYIL